MNLIDENEELAENEKKKKTFKVIIISIAFLIFLVIVLLIYITIKNNNTLKLKIDEKNANITNGLFYMTNNSKDLYMENNQIYISVKKLSSILGVEFFNDEYKNKGEDTTKCYIQTGNEYTSFLSDSATIYKAIIVDDVDDDAERTSDSRRNQTTTDNNTTKKKITEYEYFELQNGVKYVDGEIYASQEAIELGFNVELFYNPSNKTVSIYTLNQLESIASQTIAAKNTSYISAVIGDDCDYLNKKLLKYGLVLIRNNEGNYGIADYENYEEGNYVVSCKYSNIRFSESSNSVIVTTSEDNKQGILALNFTNKTADTKIEPKYQLIKQINEDLGLYLVKENSKYGIIDSLGNVILKSQYQAIGINNESYEDVDNKYTLDNKYIPVKADDLWGIISINKDKTTGAIKASTAITPQYKGIGCNLGESGTGDGVIILKDLKNAVDGIVFMSEQVLGDGKATTKNYFIINVQTGEKIGFDSNEIYSKYENNERVYYMKVTYNIGGSPVTSTYNIYKQFGTKTKENTNKNTVTQNNVITNNTSGEVNNNAIQNNLNQNITANIM